jgi:hypothetical protein
LLLIVFQVCFLPRVLQPPHGVAEVEPVLDLVRLVLVFVMRCPFEPVLGVVMGLFDEAGGVGIGGSADQEVALPDQSAWSTVDRAGCVFQAGLVGIGTGRDAAAAAAGSAGAGVEWLAAVVLAGVRAIRRVLPGPGIGGIVVGIGIGQGLAGVVHVRSADGTAVVDHIGTAAAVVDHIGACG